MKNIVICCDGTSNEVAGNQTNVLRLFRMLTRDRARQLIFYDAGVGTHADPTAQWPLRRRIQKHLDSAIAMSIRGHVIDAYRFLVHHYADGDRVFLFGFSRGAYTVRALAGMIYRCGLLCPEFENLALYAWSLFSDEDGGGDRERIFGGSARVKKVFGRNIQIHFVGVWDTVSTFGWIWDLLTVPNTDKNPSIIHIRHAISIDEQRSCFEPVLINPQHSQTVCEVWFPGVHADVGGGYPEKEGGLSRISLEWMLNEAFQQQLLVDMDVVREQLARIGNPPATPCAFDEIHNESQKWGWRLQGWAPRRKFMVAGRRYRWQWPNCAQPRAYPFNPSIHRSAASRAANTYLAYKPRFPNPHKIVDTIPCDALKDVLIHTSTAPIQQ